CKGRVGVAQVGLEGGVMIDLAHPYLSPRAAWPSRWAFRSAAALIVDRQRAVVGLGVGRQRLGGVPEQPVDLEGTQLAAAFGQRPSQQLDGPDGRRANLDLPLVARRDQLVA